jgi:hypothetical protein
MPVPVIVYFVLIPVILAIATVMAGTNRFGDSENVLFGGFVIALGWPIFVPMCILYLPFKALFFFGKWLGSRVK